MKNILWLTHMWLDFTPSKKILRKSCVQKQRIITSTLNYEGMNNLNQHSLNGYVATLWIISKVITKIRKVKQLHLYSISGTTEKAYLYNISFTILVAIFDKIYTVSLGNELTPFRCRKRRHRRIVASEIVRFFIT